MVNGTQCVIYRLFCYHPGTERWKLITQRVWGYFIPLKQRVKLSESFSCSTNFDCVSPAASYGRTIIFNDGDTQLGQRRSPITPESPGGGCRGPARPVFKAFSPQPHFPDLADEASLCSNAAFVRTAHYCLTVADIKERLGSLSRSCTRPCCGVTCPSPWCSCTEHQP